MSLVNDLDTIDKNLKQVKNECNTVLAENGNGGVHSLNELPDVLKDLSAKAVNIDTAKTIYETTVSEVVSFIRIIIPPENRTFSNYILFIYPIRGGYEGINHRIKMFTYFSDDTNQSKEITENLNHTGYKNPIAFQIYKDIKTGLFRQDLKDDYTDSRAAPDSPIARVGIQALFPEQWKIGTRVVIKAW